MSSKVVKKKPAYVELTKEESLSLQHLHFTAMSAEMDRDQYIRALLEKYELTEEQWKADIRNGIFIRSVSKNGE